MCLSLGPASVQMIASVACDGSGEESLKVHLQRITGSKSLEIPEDLLVRIIEATRDSDRRRDIMRHLQECLSEPSGKHWTRIYTALLLMQSVLQKGDHALAIETARGQHFDLLQEVRLLEHFDAKMRGISDESVQVMMHSRAQELRKEIVLLFAKVWEEESDEEPPEDADSLARKTMSCGSPGGVSTCTGTTWSCSSASTSSPTLTPLASKTPDLPMLPRFASLLDSRHAPPGLSPRSRLQAELSNIADSGVVNTPPELFSFVVHASHDPDSLVTILLHLKTKCLGELERTNWRRIYNGLNLVEHVMQCGSQHIFSEELAHNLNFNLAREIWSLQFIESSWNWRVQSLVRRKATAIWNQIRQNESDNEAVQDHTLENLDEAFASLREWVEAESGSTGSASPRFSLDLDDDSFSDDGSWVGLRHQDEEDDCRTPEEGSSCCSEAVSERFFTPLALPAEHPVSVNFGPCMLGSIFW